MTDIHTDTRPANVDHVEAQGGRNSPRFMKMLVISTALIVAAVVAIFAFSAA